MGVDSAAEPIDLKVVDALCGQRRDRALRLLVMFADDCDSERRTLNAAISSHDQRTLAESAHRLCGSARLVGATDVIGLASAIEQAARRREGARVESLALDLSRALVTVREFVGTLDDASEQAP